MIGHLNVISYSSKFDGITVIIPGSLVVPIEMRSSHIRQRRNTQQKVNTSCCPVDREGMFVELKFRKSKWLLLTITQAKMITSILTRVDELMDSNEYDQILLAGDFNAQSNEKVITDFLDVYILQNLVKDKICFKFLLDPTFF